MAIDSVIKRSSVIGFTGPFSNGMYPGTILVSDEIVGPERAAIASVYAFGFDTFIVVTPKYLYVVGMENRIDVVSEENRIHKVQAENRIYTVEG